MHFSLIYTCHIKIHNQFFWCAICVKKTKWLCWRFGSCMGSSSELYKNHNCRALKRGPYMIRNVSTVDWFLANCSTNFLYFLSFYWSSTRSFFTEFFWWAFLMSFFFWEKALRRDIQKLYGCRKQNLKKSCFFQRSVK
jgi:hypothetical protein